MPRKEFAAFTRLDASDVNTYLMDQAVQTFAGTAARGSAITTPVEGMVTYLEDLNRYDTYNGSSHVPMGGLTLVKSQTIGSAVSSVTVNDAFSADYDNYRIIVNGGVASNNVNVRMQLGSSTTGYYYIRRHISYTTGAESLSLGAGDSIFQFIGSVTTANIAVNFDLFAPFLSTWTNLNTSVSTSAVAGPTNGVHQVSDSHTGFSLVLALGTITGGTIYVYGFKKE
jgi:hypothetical protein